MFSKPRQAREGVEGKKNKIKMGSKTSVYIFIPLTKQAAVTL